CSSEQTDPGDPAADLPQRRPRGGRRAGGRRPRPPGGDRHRLELDPHDRRGGRAARRLQRPRARARDGAARQGGRRPGTALGGGSTEWITTRAGELQRIVSLPLGSLRLAGQLAGDPPAKGEVARFRRALTRRISAEIPAGGVERLVATSGTAVAAADLLDLF